MGTVITLGKAGIAATARKRSGEGANTALHGDLAKRWVGDYRRTKEQEDGGG